MRAFILGFTLVSLPFTSVWAETVVYLDEPTNRYVTLEGGDFGSMRVSVRFAGDPGSANEWVGQGPRQDKEITFARMVGEGENAGTVFIAKVSDSRLEISFKPQQKEPQDPGINGSYRRVNDSKLLQLIKKEYQAADERLQTSLRAASKNWDRQDRLALELWKEQWPIVRQKWVSLFSAQVSDGRAPSGEKSARDWLNVAQTTARAYYFIETLPDPKTNLGWEGEYDDLGGGHVSLRLGPDGRLRMSLASYRLPGDEAATLEGSAALTEMKEGKNGALTAQIIISNPEVTDPAQQAQVRLTKLGRYLHVETENTQRYAGRGWFDGIYRGSPVPVSTP